MSGNMDLHRKWSYGIGKNEWELPRTTMWKNLLITPFPANFGIRRWITWHKPQARPSHAPLTERPPIFTTNRLAALQHLPQDGDALRRAVDIRLELRNPLFLLGQFEELHRSLREAEAIAEV